MRRGRTWIDPNDLAQFPNEAGVWYQTPDDARYERRLKARHTHVMPRLMELIRRDLTEKQFMILLLGHFAKDGQSTPVRDMPRR